MSKPMPSFSSGSLLPSVGLDTQPSYLRANLRAWRESYQTMVEEASRRVFVDLSRDYRRSVYLAGDGRSGTTWLSEIINCDNRYRYLFEPFHPAFVPLVKHFRFFQYLRPDDQNESFLKPAHRVVTGAFRSPRVDSLNKKRIATRRLIKDIFSNLFLKWLQVRFPDMPLILVIRHPCAVAASKMKLKEWIWSVNPSDFLDQPELMADYLEPYRGLIKQTTDEFDKQILHWCLTHYVPLKQFRRGEVHLVAYEHLCEFREREIRRLFAFVGRTFDPKALEASSKPSATITQDSAVVRKADLVSGWLEKISPAQRRRACEIMKAFGLDIYADGPMPLIDDLASCLQPALD
jgi:Sulfotransferase family